MNPDELAKIFAERDCYGGLDLSATTDITAFVLAFPDGELAHVIPWFWIPAEGLRERSLRDRVPYVQWIEQGYIQKTEGSAVDYRRITRYIIDDLAEQFHIRDIGFDRWGAPQVAQELTDAGLTVIAIGQGYASMSAPTKHLQELVLQRRIRHYANPVLRWMCSCLTVAQDPAGNVKPVKVERLKSSRRIDGMVALIMALDRLARNSLPVQAPSISWI